MASWQEWLQRTGQRAKDYGRTLDIYRSITDPAGQTDQLGNELAARQRSNAEGQGALQEPGSAILMNPQPMQPYGQSAPAQPPYKIDLLPNRPASRR